MGGEQSAEELAGTSKTLASSGQISAFATNSKAVDWSDYDKETGTDDFDLDSAEGQEALRKLRELVREAWTPGNPELEELFAFVTEATLRFRRGDVHSSYDRVLNYLSWRAKYLSSAGGHRLGTDEELEETLRSGVMTLLPDADADGRPILYLRLKFLDPQKIAPLLMVRMFHYLIMERALRSSPAAQRHGIVMISDMGSASFTNLDTRIPKAIMGALSKNFPVRLHCAIVYRPIWLLNLLFPIVRLFLSKKMQDRIHNVGYETAAVARVGNLKLARIPESLGGSLGDWKDTGYGVDAWVEEERRKYGGKVAGSGGGGDGGGGGGSGDVSQGAVAVAAAAALGGEEAKPLPEAL